MSNDLYIVTGVRISKATKVGNLRKTEMLMPYTNEDSNSEILIKDNSFKILNVLLVGDYGSLVLETKNIKTAIRLFESIKLLMAFEHEYYDNDMKILRLDSNSDETKTYKVYDLNHYQNHYDRTSLESGIVLGNSKIKQRGELIKLTFRDNRLRTALACFFQAQEIYYTNLVGSYITSHSRPDIYMYEKDEYSFLNMMNYERYCASLTAAYRGVEAIMNVNFRERQFKSDEYKKVINNSIQGIKWDTSYLKAFHNVRYSDNLSKKSYTRVATMIKKLLVARNRAGHGKLYADQKRNNPITMELTHESAKFLSFLIIEYIESKIDLKEEEVN
ncbi:MULTISPECIES: hypothetical protein [Priestia]|uniref:Uncharacterized protein n=1 Tax=Priestia veravalensis TaxID=1414648 RepID=A0A0V8JH45_9BACI|nr:MULTISPECIES: hypothetical protein [Priestia]KSU86282.1 hypothetical protein AS180_19545 [Priestia veravalensis]SCC55045.1 hypothetical protein GA0061087_108515 [Priestia flexa]